MSTDHRARPDGPGSRPSDQTPSGSDASRFDPSRDDPPDWQLELRVFHACGTAPEEYRDLLKDFWRAYCAMEARAESAELAYGLMCDEDRRLHREMIATAEQQVAYWRKRQTHEKCLEDGLGEDGSYTPIGDEAAWSGGHCNGRYSEADWWLKTIQALASATEARRAETGTGSVHEGAVSEAETPKSPPASVETQTEGGRA